MKPVVSGYLGKVPTNMRLSWENRRCNSSIEAQPLPLVAVRYSKRSAKCRGGCKSGIIYKCFGGVR